MKTALALVGAVVLALALLGSIGIGHFRLTYSVAPLSCAKAET
jgi:hypothetical protein